MNKLDSLNRDSAARLTVSRLTKRMLLITSVGILLYACVLLPLYSQLSANVMYLNAWWVAAIGLAADVVNLAVLLLVCPITVYALWVGGPKRACRLPILYAVLIIVKQAANYAATCIADGRAPTAAELGEDLSMVLPMLGLELLQYLLIVLLSCLHIVRWQRRAAREAGVAALSGTPSAGEKVLPLSGFWNMKNPVQRSLFDSALVILLFSFFNHLMYQMTLIAWFNRTDSPAQLAIDAISDVMVAVIAYLLGLLVVNKLYVKHAAD